MENSHSKSRSKDTLRVLTDEFETDRTDEFTNYSKVILSMINGSVPDFSIGLYVECGTGKTTLMKLIYNNLADEYKVEDAYYPIIPVWFNAWMYEREPIRSISFIAD